MSVTTASTNPKQRMQIRSVFYGMWFGALIGGVLVTAIRPLFFRGEAWSGINMTMYNSIVYVLPLVVAASFTLLRPLVRYNKLHFVGFTSAGVAAGIFVSALYLLASRVLNWFSEANTASTAYVFCSAVIVAWSVWLVSLVIELIDRRRGEAR